MAAQLDQLFQSFDSVSPKFLVYEANDEALLFSCEAVKNGKTYHSKFPIDFSDLNLIIGRLMHKGIDIYEEVCAGLFESESRIREFQFSAITLCSDQDNISIAA
jgi:hypothetical protein